MYTCREKLSHNGYERSTKDFYTLILLKGKLKSLHCRAETSTQKLLPNECDLILFDI